MVQIQDLNFKKEEIKSEILKRKRKVIVGQTSYKLRNKGKT